MQLRPFKRQVTRPWFQAAEKELTGLQKEMNHVFDAFFERPLMSRSNIYQMDLYPAIDVKETDDCYILEADMPGIKEKDLELDLHNNILTICGEKSSKSEHKDKDYYQSERYFGSFRRDIPFEEEVNPNQIEATLKEGVLNVVINKKEKGKTTHQKIKINK